VALEVLWFVAIAVLWGGYFVLEGFDFGVGILLAFLPRDENERSVMFESIGPVWDGNEVWLVVAAGATFAAFPAWYATMFSAFYLVLLLILVCLIVRVVSFEWRERADDPRWRHFWRWTNTVGSVGAPFLWGLALSNLLRGIPLDGDAIALVATIFTGLYPRILVSHPDFANSLTVSGAASAHYTLVPADDRGGDLPPPVLLYQGWSYHVFRARLGGEEVEGPVDAPARRTGGA
jgi:cytochrome bd ubiquinol oxidase subunit II